MVLEVRLVLNLEKRKKCLEVSTKKECLSGVYNTLQPDLGRSYICVSLGDDFLAYLSFELFN